LRQLDFLVFFKPQGADYYRLQRLPSIVVADAGSRNKRDDGNVSSPRRLRLDEIVASRWRRGRKWNGFFLLNWGIWAVHELLRRSPGWAELQPKTNLVHSTVWVKKSPLRFSDIFPKRMGIF